MATLIFLAGGTGVRMESKIPKQYLPLHGKPLALHSFETLSSFPEIVEIIVVCEKDYQHFFSKVTFASPGKRRQDSVYSALLKSTQEMILVHDSARPFIEQQFLPPLLEAAYRTGAAALAVPMVNTVKQCTQNRIVQKTLDRSTLWEVQTPQAIKRDLLLKGYEYVLQHNIEATDDLSIIEAIGAPAELVPSTSRNFKVSTPIDLVVAHAL